MQERDSIDTLNSKGEERTLIFGKSISEAFEPYLSLYIDSQDQILANKLQTFKNERTNPPKQEEESPSTVLQSSADLFAFYRQTFSQCAKLSTSTPLVDLSKLFGKWLQLYAEQILSPPLESKTPLPMDEVCTILNTADYCLTTTTQLEERIKAKVDEPLKEQVQFDTPRESFITVANGAIKFLVRRIETETDLSFREMVNTNWSTIDTVGDHSGYVMEMTRSIKEAISSISSHGHLRERYIRSLCDRVVEWFGSRFVEGIIASRPISEAGAEQMLLDVYVLKQGLLELPVVNTDPPAQAPALYLLPSRI